MAKKENAKKHPATKPTKKEKYISERERKTGTAYEIFIRMNGQTFSKTINVSDFKTKNEALKYAVKLRDETLQKMRTGFTVSGFPTVAELYKKTFDLFPVRVKTRMRHDSFYNHGISEYGYIPIDKISSADIQTSVNVYARSHTHEQTVHFLAVWHRIYKACAMLDINIVDRTVPVTIPECVQDTPRAKSISSEDLEVFCTALLEYNKRSEPGNYRARAVYYGIQIMRYCGLRPSECFSLLRSDINLTAGYISITKASHSTYDSMLEIGAPKTKKSIRTVPIPEKLRPILIECLHWSKHEIILADFYGNLLEIRDVDTLIRNVRKKKHVNVDFNLYQLRHQFSTDLFYSGASPVTIRDLMGHESSSMSLDYAVSVESDKITAINKRNFS